MKSKRKKLKSLKQLKKIAWRLMSIYIRKLNLDYTDRAKCYTCGKQDNWRSMDAGHFIHNKLDFDPRNLKIQCGRCNRYLRGKLGVYAIKLIQEYGLEWVNQLQVDAQIKGNNYNREEIEGIIKWIKTS